MKQKNDKKPTPLPKLGIFAICLLQFSQAFQVTVLFPFIVFFVEDSGVTSESNKGIFVGLLAGVFGFCQFLVGIHWGKLGDYYGRRATLALGMTGSILASIVFGFAKNYWQGFAARVIAGVLNGNSAVLRSALSDMTDKTNVGRGFSFLSLMWGAGATCGPLIGGLLSRPDVDSGIFHDYPYLAPFLVGNIIQAAALIFTFLGIPTQKERLAKMEADNTVMDSINNGNNEDEESIVSVVQFGCTHSEDEYCYKCMRRDPLFAKAVDEKVKKFLCCWFQIGYKGWAICMGVFVTCVSYICFEEIVPLFGEEEDGGLEMSTSQIGIMLSTGAVFLFIYSVFGVHKMMHWLGILRVMKYFIWVTVAACLMMPFAQWIHNDIAKWAFLVLIQCMKHFGAVGLFVGHFILINNTVPQNSLGRSNGVMSSMAALGNCVGPFIAGVVWTIAMQFDFEGRTIFPFITAALLYSGLFLHIRTYPDWVELPFHEHILTTLGFETKRKQKITTDVIEIEIADGGEQENTENSLVEDVEVKDDTDNHDHESDTASDTTHDINDDSNITSEANNNNNNNDDDDNNNLIENDEIVNTKSGKEE